MRAGPALPVESVAFLGGIVAGCLGALVGIGGGVLLVPVLNDLVGLSFREATAASLVGVLATSSSAAIVPIGKRLHNARLALLLLAFSVSGATLAGRYITKYSDRDFEMLFGGLAAVIAGVMFVRLNRRNLLPPGTDIGKLGDKFHDFDTGEDVAYRVKRLPAALAVSFSAGALTSLVGIGGGILIVPMLNSICGVPLRVAAATSVLMVGVTAVPSLAAHWAGGFLGDYRIAGLTALGVVMGYQVGLAISPRTSVRRLKMLMAVLLAAVAVRYLFKQS
jgi:uncharacterized membrane protein YfcA